MLGSLQVGGWRWNVGRSQAHLRSAGARSSANAGVPPSDPQQPPKNSKMPYRGEGIFHVLNGGTSL